MSKDLPKQFSQIYSAFCKENKLKLKAHITDKSNLKINADSLDKDDWTPVITALKNSNDLHSIVINSKYLYKQKRSIKSIEHQHTNEPAFLRESILKSLIETLAKVMVNSKIMSSVCLEALPLDSYHVGLLNNSLDKQKLLQHLSLPYCILNEEDLISLCVNITTHTGLRTIDLTGCKIKQRGANQIALLIRSQKLTRYGEIWKQSLRYRLPDPDIVPGLRRLTLNNNPELGDEGFRVISYELFDDLWIGAIDFQNCGITGLSSEFAVELIKSNPVLKILDLRRNHISDKIVNDIMSLLSKNCEKGQGMYMFKWINSIITSKSNTAVTTEKKPELSVVRTHSAPSPTIGSKTQNTQTFCNNKEKKIKSLEILNKLKAKEKEITNRQFESCYIIEELNRTKDALHRVSSKLSEERSKRESIEKRHKQCKERLEEIRTCLKQHDKICCIDSNSSAKSTNKSSKNVKLETRSDQKHSEKQLYNRIKHKTRTQQKHCKQKPCKKESENWKIIE